MLASLACLLSIAAPKPNIIYILADDLGYGELGCYGQTKIKTPNIDQLAKEGMRFTQHYSGSPVCAPARSTFLEGKSTRTNIVRENWEEGDFTPSGKEGQFPLPTGLQTIPVQLKKVGYVTGVIGKWGLGGPDSTGAPNKQGFDYFYGYNCQRQAHNYYPNHLWENDKIVSLNNPTFNAHQKLPEGADPNDPKNYEQYKGKEFSNDLMQEKALSFIEKNKANPFFLYLPFTIPHVSLQVPDEALSQYLGKFDEKPYLGTAGYLPNQHPMSTYAAMISQLDRYVGQVIAKLKSSGIDKNTLVIFTSDNGPTWVSGITPDLFDSSAGLRGRKAQLYEGGIRVPFIARWPGKIRPNSTSDLPSVMYDMFPTFTELAQTDNPKSIEGISITPTLFGDKKQRLHDYIYWEFYPHDAGQAIRIGDYKAIRFLNPKSKEAGHTFIYNLKTDPDETNDVSDQHQNLVKKAEAIMTTRKNSPHEPWNKPYESITKQ
jgi:arylsulfatase A